MSDGQSEALCACGEMDATDPKPVWLIVGPAQSGKDTLRLMLDGILDTRSGSTSEWYCQRHWGLNWRKRLDAVKTDMETRKQLAAEMAAYNLEDDSGCLLYQRMFFSGRRLISGIRRLAELSAFVRRLLSLGVPVRIVWVVRMVPRDETLDFGPRELYRLHLDCDREFGDGRLLCVPVANTGTLEQLQEQAATLVKEYEPCNASK